MLQKVLVLMVIKGNEGNKKDDEEYSSSPEVQLTVEFTFLLARVRTAKLDAGVDTRFCPHSPVAKTLRDSPRERK
jgi:hypothetical protein